YAARRASWVERNEPSQPLQPSRPTIGADWGLGSSIETDLDLSVAGDLQELRPEPEHFSATPIEEYRDRKVIWNRAHHALTTGGRFGLPHHHARSPCCTDCQGLRSGANPDSAHRRVHAA